MRKLVLGYNKIMNVIMIGLSALVFVLLLVVSAVSPRRGSLSSFELDRRVKEGQKDAEVTARREWLLPDVISLLRVIAALLLVVLVLLLVVTFGWGVGTLLAVLVSLEYRTVAALSLIRRPSQQLYTRFEPKLLVFVERYSGLMRLFRSVTPDPPYEPRIDSRQELEHLVAGSGALLTSDEKNLILHGLTLHEKRVDTIMTPRGMIDSISKDELLGPLVLDDLHKTGHSRFPVVHGDIDHIVGMLYIQDLLVIDGGKRSGTVEKTMSPRVFYIREDHTLDYALAAFLRTRHHLFIVINEFRETVGVVSLEDVIEALLGRKIIDEFDAHDDLRAVAARNPRANNAPKKREDV